MKEQLKRQLAMEAASKVHSDWCMKELKGFFDRTMANFNGSNNGIALQKGCYKGGQKRNEVEFNVAFFLSHMTMIRGAFKNFTNFVKLVNKGDLKVKRFVDRSLTEREKEKAGSNYRAGQENILRPFEELSSASQKENLDAAIGAVNVFVELSQAGITIDEMENDPEMKDLIGTAIHTDWLKRNENHPNNDLKVPYSRLDEWTQQQDLTVYGAMLSVVKQNPKKYFVPALDGATISDYDNEEKKLLGISNSR